MDRINTATNNSFTLVYTNLLVIWLVSPNRTEFYFVHVQLHCRKEASTIRYGNRKCGTHIMHECFRKHSRMGTEDKNITNKQKMVEGRP